MKNKTISFQLPKQKKNKQPNNCFENDVEAKRHGPRKVSRSLRLTWIWNSRELLKYLTQLLSLTIFAIFNLHVEPRISERNFNLNSVW